MAYGPWYCTESIFEKEECNEDFNSEELNNRRYGDNPPKLLLMVQKSG